MWGIDPVIWNLQKTYSSASESELASSGTNWKYSSNVYTYKKALSNAMLPAEDGTTPFTLTDNLKFTIAASKLQLGKGYLFFNDDSNGGSVTIPTTTNQYVNILVGVGTAGQSLTVSGGDISSFSIPFNTKAYSINIKATGTSMTISSAKKFYLYQLAVIDGGDVVAPVITSPEPGSYYKGFSISLSCETEDVTIKFKQESSAKGFADLTNYSSAFTLSSSGNRIVSTCATKEITQGTLYSDMIAYNFTRVDDIPTPVATPAAGTYNTTQNVELSAEGLLPNGVIRYTTDGNTPSKSSAEYTSPIEVSATTTIKAYVFDASGSNKGSMLTAAYTIVELVDPVFSITATTIPSNSSAQIKVGSNDGLDGVTLSNISYGNPGVVTVNASTGVVTPVAAGTTTITFDTEETLMYNASTSNEFTVTVVDPKCATPTIAVEEEFNFENHGYKVTITNNEASSTLKVSTDGSSYTTQTSPYVTYATSTTHYYAKAVDKTGYDDSDVADKNVTNTFDPAKPYVAWVYDVTNYSGYKTSEDAIYTALASEYNMVPMGYSATTTLWNEGVNDIKNADLLVSTEAVKGGVALGNDLKNFIGALPMVNMKMFHYTTSGRWGWGSPANSKKATITPSNTLYKVLNGTAVSNGKVTLFSGGTNKVQSVEWGSALANNVNMATDADGSKIAMHAIIDDDHLDKQFFGIGLSCDDKAYYTADAITVVKNAIAIMLAGEERLDSEESSVSGTISLAGWSTFASSYPLDLSKVTATSGASAYYASAVNGSTVTLTPTGNVTVPAGEGLMIKGTAGETFTIDVAESGTAIDGNLLKGQTTTGDVAASPAEGPGTYHYVFGYSKTDASEYGFYNLAATTSVPAGKAYLELTVEEQGAPSIIRIVDEENNATSIEALGSTEKAVKFIENGQLYILREGVVYDALGRKVR